MLRVPLQAPPSTQWSRGRSAYSQARPWLGGSLLGCATPWPAPPGVSRIATFWWSWCLEGPRARSSRYTWRHARWNICIGEHLLRPGTWPSDLVAKQSCTLYLSEPATSHGACFSKIYDSSPMSNNPPASMHYDEPMLGGLVCRAAAWCSSRSWDRPPTWEGTHKPWTLKCGFSHAMLAGRSPWMSKLSF